MFFHVSEFSYHVSVKGLVLIDSDKRVSTYHTYLTRRVNDIATTCLSLGVSWLGRQVHLKCMI